MNKAQALPVVLDLLQHDRSGRKDHPILRCGRSDRVGSAWYRATARRDCRGRGRRGPAAAQCGSRAEGQSQAGRRVLRDGEEPRALPQPIERQRLLARGTSGRPCLVGVPLGGRRFQCSPSSGQPGRQFYGAGGGVYVLWRSNTGSCVYVGHGDNIAERLRLHLTSWTRRVGRDSTPAGGIPPEGIKSPSPHAPSSTRPWPCIKTPDFHQSRLTAA